MLSISSSGVLPRIVPAVKTQTICRQPSGPAGGWVSLLSPICHKTGCRKIACLSFSHHQAVAGGRLCHQSASRNKGGFRYSRNSALRAQGCPGTPENNGVQSIAAVYGLCEALHVFVQLGPQPKALKYVAKRTILLAGTDYTQSEVNKFGHPRMFSHWLL